MKEKKVFLFPHTTITILGDLDKKLPASIMPTTICKAWYMGIEEEEKGLEILFPREELKPPADLLKLLDEYKLWMRDQDKGNALFMIMEKEIWNSDESLRRIKTLIKDGEEESINKEFYKAIKWHLILHLASEFEQAHSEVDKKIKELSTGASPLENAIEGKTMPMELMFRDVVSSDIDPVLDERILKEIIMAWIGLFKDHVPDDAILLTWNGSIFNLLKSSFEDAITKDISKKEELPIKKEAIQDETCLFEVSFPILFDHKGEIEGFVSNKTLIYIERT